MASHFDNWTVEFNEEVSQYYVGVTTYRACPCGERGCDGKIPTVRPHTSGLFFEEQGDAYDWIEAMEERYEEDYDHYLEENRHAIHQSELYDMWRREC